MRQADDLLLRIFADTDTSLLLPLQASAWAASRTVVARSLYVRRSFRSCAPSFPLLAALSSEPPSGLLPRLIAHAADLPFLLLQLPFSLSLGVVECSLSSGDMSLYLIPLDDCSLRTIPGAGTGPLRRSNRVLAWSEKVLPTPPISSMAVHMRSQRAAESLYCDREKLHLCRQGKGSARVSGREPGFTSPDKLRRSGQGCRHDRNGFQSLAPSVAFAPTNHFTKFIHQQIWCVFRQWLSKRSGPCG